MKGLQKTMSDIKGNKGSKGAFFTKVHKNY
jgi:hypothetical protein